MLIGRLYCEVCGRDCTALWGFILGVRGTVRGQQQQKDLAEFKKEFGKEDMVWCWPCTAKAFGVKTLAEKEAEEQAKPDLPSPKEEEFSCAKSRFKKKEMTNGE